MKRILIIFIAFSLVALPGPTRAQNQKSDTAHRRNNDRSVSSGLSDAFPGSVRRRRIPPNALYRRSLHECELRAYAYVHGLRSCDLYEWRYAVDERNRWKRVVGARSAKRVTSVADSKVRLLGAGADAPGMSPGRLVGSTVGDELRLATNGQAKVIGMSYKDRSAILPAGKRPNGAYWFSATAGTFVSSTYYFPELPAWVQKFNTEVRPDRFFGKKWERLLPEASYSRSRKNEVSEEAATTGKDFPYTIDGGETKPGARFYVRFEYTPFANEHLIEFAKTAIENEGLGADDTPDLLTISFSANDLIGHTYGPYSPEVQDVTLRTDRLLAAFFEYLDKKIGVGRTLFVLTADHGVAPIPEHVREMGYGGRIGARRAPDAVEEELKTRFGEGPWVCAMGQRESLF